MLIKLTEYIRERGDTGIVEKSLLVNPEGIESIADDATIDKAQVPIIGSGEHFQSMRAMMMRSGRKHAIKETLDEILAAANAT
jgi:hypothetical protein